MSDILDTVLGQGRAVEQLRKAAHDAHRGGADSDAMTHSWLITGPPGSGRSTLALAFSAALLCPTGGCGQCSDCRSALSGVHVDLVHYVPVTRTISIDDARELAREASDSPMRGHWRIILVEDADRFSVDSAPVLLKAIEEPPPRTVWLMCAPTTDDVLSTIRSRCRHLQLVTPSLSAVAMQLQQRFGVDEAMAAFAAQAAQGHMGRARALATEENVRLRRQQTLELPPRLNRLSFCYAAAASVVANAGADADVDLAPYAAQLDAQVRMAFGEGAEGKGIRGGARGMKKALGDVEDQVKRRRARLLQDSFDRILLDLTGYYRDVLAVQSGADVPLINEELRHQIEQVAAAGNENSTLLRIAAIRRTRDHLAANVSPAAAFEALFVQLNDPYAA